MYDMSGKCGVIDKKGKWVLGPSYDCIHTPNMEREYLMLANLVVCLTTLYRYFFLQNINISSYWSII